MSRLSTILRAAVLAQAMAAAVALAQAPAPRQSMVVVSGPAWSELAPAQRAVLAPLERDWAMIDGAQKQKWIDIAARFPRMSRDEQARVQERMAEWAQLSPQQRGQARTTFQKAREIPSAERQARWEAYQSLPAEQRKALASQARSLNGADRRGAPASAGRLQPAPTPPTVAKSNIVPNPKFVAQPRPIGPALVQAKPGASTTLIGKPAAPPAHQQTGMPKIAASPGFVDRNTLLPLRGPQGAAALAPHSAP